MNFSTFTSLRDRTERVAINIYDMFWGPSDNERRIL